MVPSFQVGIIIPSFKVGILIPSLEVGIMVPSRTVGTMIPSLDVGITIPSLKWGTANVHGYVEPWVLSKKKILKLLSIEFSNAAEQTNRTTMMWPYTQPRGHHSSTCRRGCHCSFSRNKQWPGSRSCARPKAARKLSGDVNLRRSFQRRQTGKEHFPDVVNNCQLAKSLFE